MKLCRSYLGNGQEPKKKVLPRLRGRVTTCAGIVGTKDRQWTVPGVLAKNAALTKT